MDIRKQVLCFIAVLVVAGCVFSAKAGKPIQSDGYIYKIDKSGTGATIVGFNLLDLSELSITNNFDGIPVTIIADDAFADCINLVEITIPGSITGVGENAFGGCASLGSVTLLNDLAKFSAMAVFGSRAANLTNIVVGDEVTDIGDGAFAGCTSLGCIKIPDSVSFIGDNAFNGCTSLTNVILGTGVLYIGDNAFAGCSSLNSFVIPDSVASIGDRSFAGCSGLTNMVLGAEIAYIGDFAFRGCSNLERMVVPCSLEVIGDGAFDLCDILKIVYFEGDAPAGCDGIINASSTAIFIYNVGSEGWDTIAQNSDNVFSRPRIETVEGFSGMSEHGFGFTVKYNGTHSLVVEGATSLKNPDWVPVATVTPANGRATFRDPDWQKHSSRYYRVCLPDVPGL